MSTITPTARAHAEPNEAQRRGSHLDPLTQGSLLDRIRDEDKSRRDPLM